MQVVSTIINGRWWSNPGRKYSHLDFVSLAGDPADFGIPHLAELPAIVWKRSNLEKLRATNPAKFAEQFDALKRLLEA